MNPEKLTIRNDTPKNLELREKDEVSLEQFVSMPQNIEELVRARELQLRYKVPTIDTISIEGLINKRMLPVYAWGVFLDDDEKEALRTHLCSIDISQELDRLEITGMEKLPFLYTPEMLRQFLSQMPALALEGVAGVDFVWSVGEAERPQSSESETTLVEGGMHTFYTQENQARITVYIDSHIAFYEEELAECAVRDISVETLNSLYIEDINRTIAHEIGHALHVALPVHVLDRWEYALKVQKLDTVPVSKYTKEILSRGDMDLFACELFASIFENCYGKKFNKFFDEYPAQFTTMFALILPFVLPSSIDTVS